MVASHFWARDEEDAKAKLKAINDPIHKARGRLEKNFGTCSRHYGIDQMTCRGLAKASLQALLSAIACNFKRG